MTSDGSHSGGTNEKPIWGWLKSTLMPLHLFTGLLVIVALLQTCILNNTDKTLAIQQRAWLSALGANLVKTPEKDAGISFAVVFANSGREPATGVKVQIRSSSIDSYDPKFTNMADIGVAKNDSCEGLKPDPGRSVIPPTNAGLGVAITENTIHGDPHFVADDRIMNGAKFYLVRGCAAYLTQEKIRYTSFCYILQSEIAVAPQPNPGTRTFGFASCAAGFDAT